MLCKIFFSQTYRDTASLKVLLTSKTIRLQYSIPKQITLQSSLPKSISLHFQPITFSLSFRAQIHLITVQFQKQHKVWNYSILSAWDLTAWEQTFYGGYSNRFMRVQRVYNLIMLIIISKMKRTKKLCCFSIDQSYTSGQPQLRFSWFFGFAQLILRLYQAL